ncbi:MAG: hypothetical protein GY860_23040 [Desulfobacteraceae bacterium]|nr:hypothetical protein [Desulfobacteraceae bacterium]
MEDFSSFSVGGVIDMTSAVSKNDLAKQAKISALKQILEKRGLKSVKTHNWETIISYEGIIITPVSQSILAYDDDLGGYGYTARIQFAPIAFPDQWETLKMKHRIKEIFHDFLLFFK